jgi:molybdopterin/thiamine biosynthesis adenylyltransferase
MDFSDEQLQRYARHIILPEVGGIGQEMLLLGKVLVIGAGGLGAPLLMYLAAAGVGTLGVVDDDVVDLSNLQRQVIHATSDIGSPKVKSVATTVAGVNPEVKFQPHHVRLTSENVYELIEGYDIIADGSDNFETRFLVNDACHFAGKTLVSGAILRFEGQVATFKSHIGGDYPCYRCLYREC